MQGLKVLQLVTSYLRFKGDDSFNHEYLCRLREKGIEIEVIVPHDRENSLGFEEIDGIKIFRFQYFFPKSLQRIAYHGGIPFNLANSFFAKAQFPFFMFSFFFKTAVHWKGRDIIHAQWIPSGLIAVLLKKISKKPVVLWNHNLSYGGFFLNSITKFVLENCDFVMFNSSYTLERAKKISKMKAFDLVYPSIDEKLFRPMPKQGLRKKLGIGKGKKLVFGIGRFVEKKGFRYLIEAMALVKSKDAVCLIVGYGPLEQELKQLAEEKGLEKKVFFMGRLVNTDVPVWMNEADLVVVPSIVDSNGETETLGIVAVEAIACGKPAIVSNVGGLVDVIKDGYNGFLVNEKSPEQLAEKIDFILSKPEITAKFSANARKYCEEKFTWARAVDKTIAIYEKVAKKSDFFPRA